MSFTDIQLPYPVIAEIYKNHLVALTHQNAIHYLGKNFRKILVLVNNNEEVFLPEIQLEFLEKILSACKLNLGDIAIVNTARQPRNLDEYLREFDPTSILVFGTNVLIDKEFPGLETFKPTNQQGFILMMAPSLEKLNEENTQSKQLKAMFWHSLKQFFRI
jgi:hypothetical protein